MNKKIVYVGLNVDDTQYHGAALNKATGELFHFIQRMLDNECWTPINLPR